MRTTKSTLGFLPATAAGWWGLLSVFFVALFMAGLSLGPVKLPLPNPLSLRPPLAAALEPDVPVPEPVVVPVEAALVVGTAPTDGAASDATGPVGDSDVRTAGTGRAASAATGGDVPATTEAPVTVVASEADVVAGPGGGDFPDVIAPFGEPDPADHGGPPEHAPGPPEDPGPPDHANAPDGAGPPDHANAPDGAGPPDRAGPPGHAGRADGLGPPDGAGPPDHAVGPKDTPTQGANARSSLLLLWMGAALLS